MRHGGVGYWRTSDGVKFDVIVKYDGRADVTAAEVAHQRSWARDSRTTG
ncbi:hypothetical protein HMPREF9607_00516 [Cutibacterium modestum HL044PA1]|uniref:Uncharacterized protein n=1 Tax=Cutibacterium modestum HL044PA1 TaxID=765109 RepID=A0ABP2K8P6_9ACTN|nr:hypothetical protein HMPREF9607_00516 [Cutibacterium modestum HL044PA1]